MYFNPLPPCGGRRRNAKAAIAKAAISIHSLRVEGDRLTVLEYVGKKISIHSLRVEGDLCGTIDIARRSISIHSLRVEGDRGKRQRAPRGTDFNPLPPCGGRL